MALDGGSETVKLVSADGVEFSIDYAAAMLSETLKNSIEGEVIQMISVSVCLSVEETGENGDGERKKEEEEERERERENCETL